MTKIIKLAPPADIKDITKEDISKLTHEELRERMKLIFDKMNEITERQRCIIRKMSERLGNVA